MSQPQRWLQIGDTRKQSRLPCAANEGGSHGGKGTAAVAALNGAAGHFDLVKSKGGAADVSRVRRVASYEGRSRGVRQGARTCHGRHTK
jgi:hypothetical protein